MTTCQAEPGIAHPTVVPASNDDRAETSDHSDDACPECGRRMPSRDR